VILAAWQDIATAAPGAFLLGLFVGWIVSQRYAIVRRREPTENGAPARRKYDKGDPNGP
jgi:hypothetical protein